MRSKFAVPGFGLLVLIIMFGFIAGCSEDNVPNNQVAEGSLTDPVFIPVQTQINNYLDSSIQVFSTALDNASQVPTDTEYVRNHYSPMGPYDTVTAEYVNGWYIVYESRTNAYYTHHSRDSIRFQLDGVAIENPLDMDYMHFIHRWDFTNKMTQSTHTNMDGYVNLEFEGMDGTVATINGNKDLLVEWNYIGQDSNITARYDMSIEVNDVTVQKSSGFGWSSGCPTSGTMNADISQSYMVKKGSAENTYNFSWTVAITIQNGVANVEVNGQSKVWHYSKNFCIPPAS
jgi:hypothetical protein